MGSPVRVSCSERPDDRTWRRTQNMVAPERHRELPSPGSSRGREGQSGCPLLHQPLLSGVLCEGGHLVICRTVDRNCPQDFGPLR